MKHFRGMTLLFSFILLTSLHGQAQEPLTLMGSIQTITIDENDPFTGQWKGRIVQYLRSEEGQFYEIEDSKGVLGIKPGGKWTVTGIKRDGKIQISEAVSAHRDGEAIRKPGAVGDTTLPDTVGEQKTLVVLFKFPDQPNQPFTLQSVKDVVLNNEDSLDRFLRENSYGKTWLKADFIDWHTLPNPSSSYRGVVMLQEDSIRTIDSLVDFRNYGRLIFIYQKNPTFQNVLGLGTVGKVSLSSPKNGPFAASIAYIPEGCVISRTLAHEMGHNFGFGHAAAIYMVPESLFDPTYSAGAWLDVDDLDDTMGGMGPTVYQGHFSSIWKAQAQWIEPSQAQDVSDTGEYLLDQFELPSTGAKTVRIPLGKNLNGEESYYWIEYRRYLGAFDKKEDSIQIRTRPNPLYAKWLWTTNPMRFKRFSTKGGVISGRVASEATGAGIRNVKIWVGDGANIFSELWTDGSGDYRVSGIPAGSCYLTVFSDDDEFITSCYRDMNIQDKIRISPGKEISDVNIGLLSGAAITGRVTRDSDGSGIENVKVYVLGGGTQRYTQTDSTGHYWIEGLIGVYPSFGYIVWTENNQGFIDEYYNGVTKQKVATPVIVSWGEGASNINFSLTRKGSASNQTPKEREASDTRDTSAPAFDNIDSNKPFYDPFRGVKVEVVSKTGSDSESRVRLLVTLSGVRLDPEGILYAGTLSAGETSSNIISVRNDSTSSVTIGTLFMGGKDRDLFHISNDICSGQSLSTGGSCAVTLSFSPTSSGGKHAVIVVPSNDGIRPTATLSLYGFVSAPAVESVSTPSTPGGPDHGIVGTIYHYGTGGATSNAGDWIEYLFDWGDGTQSGWLCSQQTAWKAWVSPGVYKVKAQARCPYHPSAVSSWSEGFSVTIRDASAETVSGPNPASGDGVKYGTTGTSYTFSTRGSTSSFGHPVQYLFDWGDGTDSGWLPVGTIYASKTWSAPGLYQLWTKARCATDTSIESYRTGYSSKLIRIPGPDLTGEWFSVQQTKSGEKWKITGTLKIENIGNQAASSSTVSVYVSDDPVFNEGDLVLKSWSTGKIKADGNKSIKLNQTLKTSASGKYIIAVIDSGQLIQEVDETNNIAVFGPIP